MNANAIGSTLRRVVNLLVGKDYAGLERLTRGVRLRASEIETGIREYGRTLVLPPPEAFSSADVIAIRGSVPPAYSVRFRLHTREEGLSDLQLQATFIEDLNENNMVVQLDNIIVT